MNRQGARFLPGGRGVLLGFHGGGVIFYTRFQTWALKSIPVFRLSVGRNYVIIS